MQKLLILVLVFFSSLSLKGQEYTPTTENIQNRERFENSRFGIMIHWGLYSLLSGGGDIDPSEWIQSKKGISLDQYEQLTAFFNPDKFDALKIVKICKYAGARYINFTVKHADGFALWNSTANSFNVTSMTPFGKDPLKEFAEACFKENLGLFIHFYQLDIHNEFYPIVNTGKKIPGIRQSSDWNKYMDFQFAQLKELMSKYGPIEGIWLNGSWDIKDNVNWMLAETYRYIHSFQPATLISNNHHHQMVAGEDYELFYKTYPTNTNHSFPRESFYPVNGSWSYNLVDKNFKSANQIIKSIVVSAGYNSNFMLDIGLMPNGEIQPEVINILSDIGHWMNIYGQTIYDTRAGIIPPGAWGVSAQKGNTLYLHVHEYDKQKNEVFIPAKGLKIKSLKWFSGEPAEYTKTNEGLEIKLSKDILNDNEIVLEITLKV